MSLGKRLPEGVCLGGKGIRGRDEPHILVGRERVVYGACAATAAAYDAQPEQADFFGCWCRGMNHQTGGDRGPGREKASPAVALPSIHRVVLLGLGSS